MSGEINPDEYRLHGLRNGKPHTITFDIRERVVADATYRGESLSDDEISYRAQEMRRELDATKEAIARPKPPTVTERLGRLARRS